MDAGVITVIVVFSILALVILIYLVTRIKIVRQTSKYVVERLGGYHATWGVGFHFLCPFVDRVAYVVSMKEQVKEVAKKMRRTRLMKLQQNIAFEAAKKMVGTTLDAIIEGYLPEEDCYVCRTYKDMPDIDGMLFLQLPLDASRDLLSGTIVQVRVTGAREYDLIGELAEAL